MTTLLDALREQADAESRVSQADHLSLRLWLRLLTCTTMIERRVRERLRERFDITLARFDLMAQLARTRHGLRMSELSRRLMVTGGNVTGLTDQLVAEGLVVRREDRSDRRVFTVSLTPKGRRALDRRVARRPSCRRARGALRTARAAETGARAGARRTRGASIMMETRRIGAYAATHFRYAASDDGKVATITLDRPTRRNPLTFDAYAELRDLFRALALAEDVKAVVVTGSGGHFCSGGDVHEIIGPLTAMSMPQLLAFTRMTGDVVLAMRTCPQPIVAVVDGTCAGAGAMIALGSDFRIGTPEAKTAFLFVRVGLAGCDMGACALLPRVVGQGRAAELLYTGRVMTAEEGRDWGFFNRLVAGADALADGHALARSLADGPTFAHAMTKKLLHQAWSMDLATEIEAEAQAQAICMQTADFRRAYEAFAAKERPTFEGN